MLDYTKPQEAMSIADFRREVPIPMSSNDRRIFSLNRSLPRESLRCLQSSGLSKTQGPLPLRAMGGQ